MEEKSLEAKLRKQEDYWPKTIEDLNKYISGLVNQEHSYGSCVYAVSLASVATFNYMAHKLGITGFQASCADMDILKRIRNMEDGFSILNYNNLLYPQYLNEEHFPSFVTLIRKNKIYFSKKAKELLKTRCGVHPDIKKHWIYLSKLK